ncbi:MAG: glycosyltransferase family 9 protein [bacterium]|nr:glycosyltransferase family 9 protein [bacterium]
MKKPLLDKPRKILFVHLGALGDFLLALPALVAYQEPENRPELHICAGGDIRRLALAGGRFQGEVDPEGEGFQRLFSPGAALPESLARILSRFDLVITTSANQDLLANLRRLVPAVLSPGKPDPLSRRHLHDEYLGALLLPGMKPEISLVENSFSLPEALAGRGRELLKSGPRGRALIIHPGSGGAIKCWPLTYYLDLAARASRMGLPPFFLLGPAEKENPEFANLSGSGFSVLSGLTLVETAAVLANAKIYVGNDSGITHLAAAMGRPVIAIFGPSDPGRFGPRGRLVKIISLNYECSPCHPRNPQSPAPECRKKRACLLEIKPEAVVSFFNR